MRLTQLSALTPEELNAWEQLAERAVEPNPFFEPAFVTVAANALDATGVQLLFDTQDGSWTGCMPVQLTRAMGLPLLLSTWKHSYSFLGTPLVDRDHVGDFSAALMRSVRDREHARFLLLRRSSDGPVLDAFKGARGEIGGLNVIFERSFVRAALARRPEFDYLSSLKSRRRSELKRLRRRLADELGGEIASRNRTDYPEAVETFLRLEASGWKGKEGTAMASEEGSADLFRSICAELSKTGRINLRSLEAGDRVAAMTCDISAGDTLFGFKSAYDEQLGRYSPGIQLQIDNFTAFHEQRDERLMDSCSEPTNEAANSLWPDRRPISTLVIGPSGLSGRIAAHVLDAVDRVRTRRRRG